MGTCEKALVVHPARVQHLQEKTVSSSICRQLTGDCQRDSSQAAPWDNAPSCWQASHG